MLALLCLYRNKRKRINELNNTRRECLRFMKKYARYSNLKIQLVAALLMLFDDSPEINRHLLWSFDKSDNWWTEVAPKLNDRQFSIGTFYIFIIS